MTDADQPYERELDQLLALLLADERAARDLPLGRRLSASFLRGVAGDVPRAQLRAVAALSAGDLRMHELARRLSLATSTVTRLVDRLEAAGLAERRAEQPDRRSVLVGLTAGGHETLRTVRRRLGLAVRELTRGLAPHERRALLQLLAKLGGELLRPVEPAVA